MTAGAGGERSTGGATSAGSTDASADAQTCSSGLTLCDGRCVDTGQDVDNCGACGRQCSHTGTTGTPSCAQGICQPTCAANLADCNQPSAPDADDGCEANLTTSAANCGSCGHTCYLGACKGTCQPWKVVDTPDTGVPALLATDGTYVVWLDTGLTSIRQVRYDKSVVLTLSTDSTAFSKALSTLSAPLTLGGGIILLATGYDVYEAALNTRSTTSKRLALNTPAGARLRAVGIDTTGMHFGLAATTDAPIASQIYECQVVDSTCAAVGASFTGGVYGAAANGSAYYFMNAEVLSIQYFMFGSIAIKTLQPNARLWGILTLDSTSAYWGASAYNGDIVISRGKLASGSTTNILSSFPLGNAVSDIATDGKNVYFASSGAEGYIGYASVGGVEQAAKLLAKTSTPSSVAAGAGKVFWIDGTAIWAVAAP
jgi:hypothetical protein